ncbi:MAG: hypothetical protein R3E89_19000 [Thiolinea sp.]
MATYVRAIDIEMRQTGRSVYEKAIQDMKTLATLPGGQPAMQELLQRLRLEYRNRRAMLQLFDKALVSTEAASGRWRLILPAITYQSDQV